MTEVSTKLNALVPAAELQRRVEKILSLRPDEKSNLRVRLDRFVCVCACVCVALSCFSRIADAGATEGSLPRGKVA